MGQRETLKTFEDRLGNDDRRKKAKWKKKNGKQKNLQDLKQKEIEEKLVKLKEVTGTTRFALEEEDIDGDLI